MARQTTAEPASGSRAPFRTGADVLRLLLRMFSVREPDLGRGTRMFMPALVLRLVGVGLLAWVGWIHWVLWHTEGYRFIPNDGPFFLVDAIAGVLLALVLLVWPRPIVGLASAGFVAGTILALVISLTVGLFGFNETISANYVVLALVVESITTVVLLAWTALAALAVPSRR